MLLTIGTPGQRGDDATHFNSPSDVITAPNGDIFVTDGHAPIAPIIPAGLNMRVMKFDAKGKFIKQWGKPGAAAGEFNNPHALGLDKAQMRNALGLALCQSSGTLQAIVEKTLAKRMQSAFAARNGVYAAELARHGITGPADFNAQLAGFLARANARKRRALQGASAAERVGADLAAMAALPPIDPATIVSVGAVYSEGAEQKFRVFVKGMNPLSAGITRDQSVTYRSGGNVVLGTIDAVDEFGFVIGFDASANQVPDAEGQSIEVRETGGEWRDPRPTDAEGAPL